MRVLMASDTISGVWRYTRELVTGLIKSGVEVTLVSMGEIPASSQTQWMDGLRGLDYRPTAFRLEWMRDSHDDLRAAADFILNLAHEAQPDLLHVNQFYLGALDTGIPIVLAAHSDVLSWWRSVHPAGPKNDDGWIAWYRDTVCRGLQHASAVVAPSQWMLSMLSAVYTPPHLASVIYPGCDPNTFNPHMSKENIAVSVGRIWDYGKNSALLSRFESPIPLYLLGPDSEPQNAANQKAFPPRQRLHVKNVEDDKQMRLLYAKSAMYVATSQYEPFGISAVDAALSRCAIIASDIPTHREVWGEAAIYFTNNEADSLARALRELSGDSELRATYGKLAYDRARARYSAARMAGDYLALYQALKPAGAMAA
jgi:glycogen synthase